LRNLYPISHQSAFEFWRNAVNLKYLKKLSVAERKITSLPEKYVCPAGHEVALKIHNTFGVEYPVILMQPAANNLQHSKWLKCVVRPKGIPPSSFVEIGHGVMVASPEYCFISLARNTSIEKLVEVANNLCARYLIDEAGAYGQRSMDMPICTVSSIEKYCSKVKILKGINKARVAIKYAVDNSNSPMESKLAVILCLPKNRGGYGFKKMKMNYCVHLSEIAAKHMGRETLMVDMVWPKEKVAVEYDSNASHLTSSQHAYDKERVNALIQSGYRVITITSTDLRNLKALDAVTELLRFEIHIRSKKAELEKYRDKRLGVLKNLFY